MRGRAEGKDNMIFLLCTCGSGPAVKLCGSVCVCVEMQRESFMSQDFVVYKYVPELNDFA